MKGHFSCIFGINKEEADESKGREQLVSFIKEITSKIKGSWDFCTFPSQWQFDFTNLIWSRIQKMKSGNLNSFPSTPWNKWSRSYQVEFYLRGNYSRKSFGDCCNCKSNCNLGRQRKSVFKLQCQNKQGPAMWSSLKIEMEYKRIKDTRTKNLRWERLKRGEREREA